MNRWSSVRVIGVGIFLVAGLAAAEPEAEPKPEQASPQPDLFDHYRGLQQMQQSLLRRSQEEQARLQPQMQRAEREACRQLARERLANVSSRRYRQQGGDEFVAFVLQFEQYCRTLE